MKKKKESEVNWGGGSRDSTLKEHTIQSKERSISITHTYISANRGPKK